MATRQKRAGRPPVAGKTRSSGILIRVTAEERERLHEAARSHRRTLGDWARLTLLDASEAAPHQGPASP